MTNNTQIDVRDLVRGIFEDVQRNTQAAQLEAIRANPVAHKDTKMFDKGKMQYRYYERRDVHKGNITRFCWTLYPNVAGYYLSFIEVVEGGRGARTKFIGFSRKRDAIADCRARYWDCEKAKADRKYTVPSCKELYSKR